MEIYDKGIFAKNLNRLLILHDIRQSDLVEYFGVSKSTVSAWCAGAKIPRMDKIEALSKYFGVKKSDLLEDKQKELASYAQRDKLSDEQKMLTEKLSKLTPENLALALEQIDSILRHQERK